MTTGINYHFNESSKSETYSESETNFEDVNLKSSKVAKRSKGWED